MNLLAFLYLAVLFFVLTPGVVLTLPDQLGIKSNIYIQAGVHALAFALVLYLSTLYMPMQ